MIGPVKGGAGGTRLTPLWRGCYGVGKPCFPVHDHKHHSAMLSLR